MSRAMEGIFRAMASLGLYRLDGGSYVERELSAYGRAFADLEAALEEAGAGALPQTASGEALARHEELVGLAPRRNLTEEARRALVLYRLGSAPFAFDREGMINSIRATGMEAELEEHLAEEALTVRYVRGVDHALGLDALRESARTVLPAHLAVEFDMGSLTWDLFDAAGKDWDGLDALGATWDEFDLGLIGGPALTGTAP